MVRETPQELRDRAADWERQGIAAQDPRVRDTLLHVAARLRELADEDEGLPARRQRVAA
jgi:hypothetical protein